MTWVDSLTALERVKAALDASTEFAIDLEVRRSCSPPPRVAESQSILTPVLSVMDWGCGARSTTTCEVSKDFPA